MISVEQQLRDVLERFQIVGEYRGYELIESGHINVTYKVYYFRHGELKDYILQKVNTYVFKNPQAVMKNISAAPIDFDETRLTERFVRGDESRTTEGSGLGLSITQSLAEIQGGTFGIQVDGDLFKSIVSIPLWMDEEETEEEE